jgi:2-iminobutanoate/2-iminopropanoate deaminase
MSRTTIRTPQAPAAIGPYSQAVVVPIGAGRKMIFCSGQIPIDPASGSMVGGDIAVQTRRVLDNLGAVLAAAGASFNDLVKTTIFLTDLGDFPTVNKIYAERFAAEPPARSTVQAAQLPREAKVEIEAIAIVQE